MVSLKTNGKKSKNRNSSYTLEKEKGRKEGSSFGKSTSVQVIVFCSEARSLNKKKKVTEIYYVASMRLKREHLLVANLSKDTSCISTRNVF